jgi:hypothetical protein
MRSRYVPACTVTVSPGWAIFAAAEMALKGFSAVPSWVSAPVTATWNSVAEATAARRAKAAPRRNGDFMGAEENQAW